MRVRAGKYFKGPGGTYVNVSTGGGGGGKKKGSMGIGTKVIIGLLIIGLFAILIMLAWIPALIYLIKCLIDKNTPKRKEKIIISAAVAIVSFIFMIVSILTGSLTGLSVEWPQTEFQVSESAEITLLPEPESANVTDLELCENSIATLEWDQTYQTATVTFTTAGSEELYFIANGKYQTEPVLITVTEPEIEESLPETVDEQTEAPEEITPEVEEPVIESEPEEVITEEPQPQEEQNQEASDTQTEQPEQSQSTETMVWVDDTAARYHRKSDCSGMDAAYQVTIEQAEAMGKTPCGRCY